MFSWPTFGFKIVNYRQDTLWGGGESFLNHMPRNPWRSTVSLMARSSPYSPLPQHVRWKVYRVKNQALFSQASTMDDLGREADLCRAPLILPHVHAGRSRVFMWIEWPHQGRYYEEKAKMGPRGPRSSSKERPGRRAGEKTQHGWHVTGTDCRAMHVTTEEGLQGQRRPGGAGRAVRYKGLQTVGL